MEFGRRIHLHVGMDRCLPVTLVGTALSPDDLDEVLAILHDKLPPLIAACHDGKTASAPEIFTGPEWSCCVKLLPLRSDYRVLIREAGYRSLQPLFCRAICACEKVVEGKAMGHVLSGAIATPSSVQPLPTGSVQTSLSTMLLTGAGPDDDDDDDFA
eukprot:CAMPEP_0206056144 /NCGR_PEP_ID=MMETSP1466-20131121/41564_1 /ASSEMBLY_ACC=CAM_ASM_001126 /TAXON_ID=44452 /ORGANISM="Pavlova gyrans, Strain CCMP608" /LENGTH=156 /DNA_ID=CAMNT_0053431377 /DNA_START=18 /DNA_END=488 /DNA_ORIENTATION=+